MEVSLGKSLSEWTTVLTSHLDKWPQKWYLVEWNVFTKDAEMKKDNFYLTAVTQLNTLKCAIVYSDARP